MLPFCFYTNGQDHYFWDLGNYPPRKIIGYTPPMAVEVPVMMAELVQWLNVGLISPGAAQRHRSISGSVHPPFLNGNGRTSRLLSTFCLYKVGYDFKRLFTISECYDCDRLTFYRSIQSVRDKGMDMTGWLDYFVIALVRMYEQALEMDPTA